MQPYRRAERFRPSHDAYMYTVACFSNHDRAAVSTAVVREIIVFACFLQKGGGFSYRRPGTRTPRATTQIDLQILESNLPTKYLAQRVSGVTSGTGRVSACARRGAHRQGSSRVRYMCRTRHPPYMQLCLRTGTFVLLLSSQQARFFAEQKAAKPQVDRPAHAGSYVLRTGCLQKR